MTKRQKNPDVLWSIERKDFGEQLITHGGTAYTALVEVVRFTPYIRSKKSRTRRAAPRYFAVRSEVDKDLATLAGDVSRYRLNELGRLLSHAMIELFGPGGAAKIDQLRKEMDL